MEHRDPQIFVAPKPDVARRASGSCTRSSSSLFPGAGVGTFWARGPLSVLDQACLLSFVRRGINLTLFSYAPPANVPDGIVVEDAASILPESLGRRIIYGGRPDVCHFSDFFRYEMLRQRNLTWVDTDVLLIGDGDFSDRANLLIAEEPRGLNNAILYISDAKVLATLRSEVLKLLDRDLRWGETGPALIEKVNSALGTPIEPTPHTKFYPIGYHDIWKILLPEHFDYCATRCEGAVTVHLFNNILSKIGYWKVMAPPPRSYLHHLLERNAMLPLFSDTYPENVMRAIVTNYLYRQNGRALGVKTILREFVPSMIRTYRNYYK